MKLTFVTAVVLALAAATPAVAQKGGKPTLPPAAQGVLIDATGKTIGPYHPFYGFNGVPQVMASINGRMTTFGVVVPCTPTSSGCSEPDVTKLMPNGGGIVYFTDFSCQGTAYVQYVLRSTYGANPISVPGLHPSAVIGGSSGPFTIYVGAPGPQQTIYSNSRWQNGCVGLQGGVEYAVPVAEIVSLDTLFPTPYSVK